MEGSKAVRAAVSLQTDTCLAEMVVDENGADFIVFENGAVSRSPHVATTEGRVVPYSLTNTLVTHRVVLFPSDVEALGSREKLLEDVRSFIHRYVDVSESFEQLAAWYVALSWVYDDFGELPYLRVRGDFGCGKTRFLQTVGSIAYKPMFASGASR